MADLTPENVVKPDSPGSPTIGTAWAASTRSPLGVNYEALELVASGMRKASSGWDIAFQGLEVFEISSPDPLVDSVCSAVSGLLDAALHARESGEETVRALCAHLKAAAAVFRYLDHGAAAQIDMNLFAAGTPNP